MKSTVSTMRCLRPNLPPMPHGNSLSIMKCRALLGALLLLICLSAISISAQNSPPVTVAVLDLGDTQTGSKAAAALRNDLRESANLSAIDQYLAAAAARGNGYQGSLNLTTQE